MKHPYMPLWVGEFVADIEHLTPAETGAYFRLVLFYWSNGGLPELSDGTSDEIAIARITRLDRRTWARSYLRIRALFKDPRRWTHPKIEAVKAQVIEKSKINSANAKRSHSARRANAEQHQNQNQNKNLTNGQKPKLDTSGFVAQPESEEFKKWKAWAFEHNTALWRELQKRETEGRSFDFQTQWPVEVKH